MSPRAMMWLGAISGVFGVVLFPIDGMNGMIAFAGGMLFGKGYGIWEERSRKRRSTP